MAYEIVNKIIPGLPKTPYTLGIGAFEGVIAHATDDYGATDENEANYFLNNWKTRGAFVQLLVDWDSITQTSDLSYRCWGAGAVANAHYVSVELCQTTDKDLFQESYNRYVWVIAWVLFQRRLGVVPKKTLWTHKWVSEVLGGTNHQDPDAYLASHGVTIDNFVVHVTNEYNKLVNPPKPQPVNPSNGLYTVVSGDTLWAIATKYHVTVAQLQSWNPGIVADQLQVGTVLHISAPAAPAPTPAPATKEYVSLPASEDSWRLYPTNVSPTKGNEKAMLNPKKFGGLTYEVLGHPYPNVVTISTSNFGTGNIYVGADTGAKLFRK